MYYTVYQTTNKINGMIYVGYHQTKNLEDDYLGSGKYLRRAIKTYGKENFERTFLKIFDNKTDAENFEAEIVNKEFTEREDTYNFALGGNVRAFAGKNNPMYGVRHSDDMIKQIHETRAKTIAERGYTSSTPNEYWLTHKTGGKFYAQEKLKAFYGVSTKKRIICKVFEDIDNIEFYLPTSIDFYRTEYEKIQKHTQEQKKKQSDACRKRMTGRVPSEAERKKRSDSKKGTKNPWNQITNRNPEKIRKMAEKHRGMKRSDEAKANISAAHIEIQARNKVNPDHSPCAGKYLYKTPIGTFKNPHCANIDGLDGYQVALACQFGNRNRTITKRFNSEKFNNFFSNDIGKTYADMGFQYA